MGVWQSTRDCDQEPCVYGLGLFGHWHSLSCVLIVSEHPYGPGRYGTRSSQFESIGLVLAAFFHDLRGGKWTGRGKMGAEWDSGSLSEGLGAVDGSLPFHSN